MLRKIFIYVEFTIYVRSGLHQIREPLEKKLQKFQRNSSFKSQREKGGFKQLEMKGTLNEKKDLSSPSSEENFEKESICCKNRPQGPIRLRQGHTFTGEEQGANFLVRVIEFSGRASRALKSSFLSQIQRKGQKMNTNSFIK